MARPLAQALRSLALLVAGAAGMAGLGLVLLRVTAQVAAPAPRPGWSVLRPPHDVAALAVLDDVVWAGGRDGLAAIDRRALTPVSLAAPPMSHVTALLVGTDRRLWVAHYEGLSVRSGTTWSTLARGKELPARPLSLLDDTNGLWVGTEHGLLRWDGARFVAAPAPPEPELAGIDVLHRDPAGVIWAGSASPRRGGLLSWDGRAWRRHDAEAGLPHPAVNALLTARDGSLWVGTGFANRGGACRRFSGRWQAWTTRDGLAGEKVRSLFEDGAGRLWLGSEYDGVAIRDGERWRYIRAADGLAGREVKAVIEDRDGVFWLGTDGGLTRIASAGLGWPQ